MNTHNAELKKKIATNFAIFQSVRRADLAMQIRTKMLEKGLRSVDIAERLGVSEANVSRWLRGDQNLGIDTMHLFADALEVPLKITFSESSAISKEALAQPDQDEVDIRSCLYQRIHELETQLAQPEQDWIERERAVGYREGHQNALKQMAQPEQEPVAWLSDDERKAFQRFYETWDDGEGYDVPKPMMKRLAQIGVIHHISRGLYDITKFGHSLLGYATSSHPPVPTAQPKELEQEISVAVLQAITNAGMTLLKTQHGYELRKLGPAIAHGIKE